jgi:hypothetical protein
MNNINITNDINFARKTRALDPPDVGSVIEALDGMHFHSRNAEAMIQANREKEEIT